MKFVTALSAAALAGVLLFALSVPFDFAALPLFAAAASLLLLLIGVVDYTPRRSLFALRALRRRTEPIPLAA